VSSLLSPNQTGFTAINFSSFNKQFLFRLLLSKIENNAALTGAFALIMAATATIISAKRLSNVLLLGVRFHYVVP
jgi:hypothetical protein